MNTPTTTEPSRPAPIRSKELLCHPVSYKLPWTRFKNGPEWLKMEVVATKFSADGVTATHWAVREGSAVLSKDGEWEYEPMPSSRDDDFVARTRYATALEAAEAAERWHNAPDERRPE